MRWRAVAAGAGAVALTLGFAADPARAITTPAAGTPCGTDDVGRRAPVVSSLDRQPVVTHFLALYAAAGGGPGGAGGEALYTLPVVGQVATETSGNATTRSSWTTAAAGQIAAAAGYPVRDVPSTTTSGDVQLMWHFANPGYYALYRGVRRPTGTLDSLQCSQVTLPDGSSGLRWVARPAGAFTAYGTDETGVVRCDEFYPTGTLRWEAQNQLCAALLAAGDPVAAAGLANRTARERGLAATARSRAARAEAEPDPANPAPETLAAPPGFTCDAGSVRLVTVDGQLAVGTNGNSASAVLLRSAGSGTSVLWKLCHSTAAEFPEVVLQSRWTTSWSTPRCLDLTSAGFADDAALDTPTAARRPRSGSCCTAIRRPGRRACSRCPADRCWPRRGAVSSRAAVSPSTARGGPTGPGPSSCSRSADHPRRPPSRLRPRTGGGSVEAARW
jgi:hypothetical protein